MATIESLEVRSMLDSSGFIRGASEMSDSYNNLVRSTQRVGQVTSDASDSFGSFISSAKGLAVAFAGAFTAKRALDDFAKSTLPGAAEFNQSVVMMQDGVKRLSEAVGEFLAPGAMLFNRILEGLSRKLEPFVRMASAFKSTATNFLMQMGQNALAALRNIMPNVAGIFDGILAWWDQNMDFTARFEQIREAWNKTWRAIGEFVAPIIVRLASLIDAVVDVVRDGLVWALGLARDQLAGFGNAIDFQGIIDGIQAVMVAFIGAAEFTIRNWQMVGQIIGTAGAVGIEFLKNNFLNLASYTIDVFTTIGQNLFTILTHFGTQLQPTFAAIAQNISEVFGEAFTTMLDSLQVRFKRWRAKQGSDLFGLVGTLTGQPYMEGGLVSDAEIDLQNPLPQVKPIDWSKLTPIPLPDLAGNIPGLRQMPGLNLDTSKQQEALLAALGGLTTAFNQGVVGQIANTALNAQQFLGKLLQNLPGVNANPAGRLQRNDPIASLLLGTAAAAMRESNQASKNPLVPLAQQQNQISAEILVQQRAAAAAAARKARIANF